MWSRSETVDLAASDDAVIEDVAPPRGPLLWLAWAVAGSGFLALALGFGLTMAQAMAAPLDVSPTPAPIADAPLVAVVIDDVGLDRAAAERALALPAPVTIALLPYADGAPRLDAAARAAGHETIVHLPMEPLGLSDPGPDALTTWLSPDEVSARTERALARAPGARGLNNHMGSRFTRCAACVAEVAAAAVAHGLFVLDSLTTPDSRLADAARAAGAPVIARDVFLDNDPDADAVRAALDRAEAIARGERHVAALATPES